MAALDVLAVVVNSHLRRYLRCLDQAGSSLSLGAFVNQFCSVGLKPVLLAHPVLYREICGLGESELDTFDP